MKNNFVRKGDFVRIGFYEGSSKTLFKVVCYRVDCPNTIIVKVDSIKNEKDKLNVCGWSGNYIDEWKEKYGLSSNKKYWYVNDWERIDNKLKI